MRYFISADGNSVISIDGATVQSFRAIASATTETTNAEAAENADDLLPKTITLANVAKVLDDVRKGLPASKKKKKKAHTPPSGKSRISPEIQKEICDEYKSGTSTAAVAEKFDVSGMTVLNILHRHKIKVRPKGHQKKVSVSEESDDKEEIENETPAPDAPAVPHIRLTPDKLAKIKRMLGEGDPMALISMECGVSEETVERVALSLGL